MNAPICSESIAHQSHLHLFMTGLGGGGGGRDNYVPGSVQAACVGEGLNRRSAVQGGESVFTELLYRVVRECSQICCTGW
jgi:hypothetical protein